MTAKAKKVDAPRCQFRNTSLSFSPILGISSFIWQLTGSSLLLPYHPIVSTI